ncbi:MAG TPA: HAMP domain-containing sensor histidine kinase [Gaiellaceae bacterium]|nr:HAMP domain-containing sensor histidine kinase [Gaiellaceae bacterium]
MSPVADDTLRLDAERGRRLVEESREFVLVLDEDERVVAASRRARQALEGIVEGARVTEEMLVSGSDRVPFRVPYEVDGKRETLLYLGDPGELAAYEELRAGFTAAVSHELRTPLARLLAHLENAQLPDANVPELLDSARGEVAEIGELIDDVLFLSELESGRALVGLGSTVALPILREVVEGSTDKAARAGVRLAVAGEEDVELPLRPRMIRVVATNLVDNAIRYAGAGATLTLSVAHEGGDAVLAGSDDGIGVAEADLARLFERFYRTDRARASRGTGLGLAIVKHVVNAAGGRVEAEGGRGAGLTVRCVFPASP